jgi:thiosulfate dehydrogenase [quinone] large subunit
VSALRKNVLAIIIRVLFGFTWIFDGLLETQAGVTPQVLSLLYELNTDGQPSWLTPWFNFWSPLVMHHAALMLRMLIFSETIIGVALVLGVARKIVYYFGIPYSILLWGLSGFGGPYTPYSSDIGAPVIYAFVFLALIGLEQGHRQTVSHIFSFDALIERRLKSWSRLAELNMTPTQSIE